MFCVNCILLIGLVWKHIQYRQIQHEKLMTLERAFPSLTDEQVKGYLNQLFANISTFDQKTYLNHIKYTLYHDYNSIGHAYQVKKDIACPVCEDVRFFIGINLHGLITGVVLVNQFHLYGSRMNPEKVNEFLSQFINEKLDGPFRLNLNIEGITGATKTTQYFLDGVLGISEAHRSEAK